MSDSNDNRRQSAESLSDELLEFCNSDSLSEEGVREIIECHQTPHDVNNYQFFHAVCSNKKVNEGIIQCLLEYFPAAASASNKYGLSPLHYACQNPNVSLKIAQLLIDAPASVRSVDNYGRLPLHHLCKNEDDRKAMQILKLLIEKQPEAIRHADNEGCLPIHYACAERCPESTVKYFYKLYPDAINHATTAGWYPIYAAIKGLNHRDSPIAAAEIVQFLLGCDPHVKLQKFQGMSLLHYACRRDYNDSKIETGIQIIKAIYDAHPEAIEDEQ